jgi:HNH endonuclease
MITQDRLKELLSYDRDTGKFTRLVNQGNTKEGDVAGYNIEGYTYICIDLIPYPAHRLAFLYVEGVYPETDVDHKDMDRDNNKWENLRVATRASNMLNIRSHKDNPLQCKNVSYRKDTQKYGVRLMVNGKYKSIGSFEELEFAMLVAEMAREKYHGEYARHV